MPGAFKLDHLQHVKLILLQNFLTILTFILRAPISNYPRTPLEHKLGKMESSTVFQFEHMQPVTVVRSQGCVNSPAAWQDSNFAEHCTNFGRWNLKFGLSGRMGMSILEGFPLYMDIEQVFSDLTSFGGAHSYSTFVA